LLYVRPIIESVTLLSHVCIIGWLCAFLFYAFQSSRFVSYGKLRSSTPSTPSSSSRTCFTIAGVHFYGVRVSERTGWTLFYVAALSGNVLWHILVPKLHTSRWHIIFFQLHALRRLYEVRCVHQWSTPESTSKSSSKSKARKGKCMDALQLVAGLAFYALMTLSLHVNVDPHPPSMDSFVGTFATVVVVAAQLVQYVAHRHLASLRKYTVPQSKLFTATGYVPHYLAECAFYGALYLLAGVSNVHVALGCAFVVTNLSVRAIKTHQFMHTLVQK
jgi:hypothetical protein